MVEWANLTYRVYSSLSREAKAGTQVGNPETEMKQRPGRSTAYWFVPHALLNLSFYIIEDYLPTGGIAHTGLDLLKSIIDQENISYTQTAHSPVWFRNSSNEGLSSGISLAMSSWHN